MSRQRLSMRKIRELLRLKHELGRSHREIAGSRGIANSTVSDYVRRAAPSGFTWARPEGLDSGALEEELSVVPGPGVMSWPMSLFLPRYSFDSPPTGRTRSPTMRSSASQILTMARAS